jgi:hypothetical protein
MSAVFWFAEQTFIFIFPCRAQRVWRVDAKHGNIEASIEGASMLAFSSARMKRHFHSKPERMSLERVTRSPVIAKETLEAERGKHGQDRTRVPNGAIGNRRATIAARCTRQEHSGEPPSRARLNWSTGELSSAPQAGP